ncbi:MAG: hypothetical protein ACK56I_11045, partial [bacterium]
IVAMPVHKLQARSLAERWHHLQGQIRGQIEALDGPGLRRKRLPLDPVGRHAHQLRDNPAILLVFNLFQTIGTQF